MANLNLLNERRRRKLAAVSFMVVMFAYINIVVRHFFRRRCAVMTRSLTNFSRRDYIMRLVFESDTSCHEQLRMKRTYFFKLCAMLKDVGGLKSTRFSDIYEQVAMTLYILGHDEKNRVIKFNFERSGETVSRNFNKVLLAILRLHNILTKQAEPIPLDSNDERWKWFKNCLGALDGTHIELKVPLLDRPRYRNCKGDITTNVLAACAPNMQFTYVQPGWEGSASDSRILRDFIAREHGLKVPVGCYYLVDAGYANSDGFLAPYRGVRYHLREWENGYQPTNPKEYFNMKHSMARNVIERAFGAIKGRWAILRRASHYPVRIHNRIVHACCLLHNFILQEKLKDALDNEILEDFEQNDDMESNDTNIEGEDIVDVQPTTAWSMWRDELANQMFNSWRAMEN